MRLGSFESVRTSSRVWAIFFIVLLTLLVAVPLWQKSGLPWISRDVAAHVHRCAAVLRAFEQGVYWPRWFVALYDGLGAPTFHHYGPAFYLLTAAAHAVGFSLDISIKAVLSAALLLSGFGVYGWLRFAFSPAACLAAVALYLLNPYFWARSLHFKGNYPQLLALLLLPLCLWALTALHQRSSISRWLGAVAALAALVVSHNLTAMLGAVIFVLYWLLLAIGWRRPESLLRCALAGLIAVLLSAAFWLPALADLPFVQFDKGISGQFHFSQNFLSWKELFRIQSPILDGGAGNDLRAPASLSSALWIALGLGLAASIFAAERAHRMWGLAGCAFALFSLLMTLPLSEPLWEAVPVLGNLQFPYRFMGIAPLGVLPAAALVSDSWPVRLRWLPCTFLVIVSFTSLFPYLFPAYTQPDSFRSVVSLSAADTRLAERNARNWGLVDTNEFLVSGGDLNVVGGRVAQPEASEPRWNSAHEAVVDLSGQEGPALVRLHFHPGWGAGERATLTRGVAGWMQVSELRDRGLPLLLRWEGTVWQERGELVSIGGLVVAIAGLLVLVGRRQGGSVERRRGRTAISPKSPRTAAAMTGCLLLLVAARYAIDWSSAGPYWRHTPPGDLPFRFEGQTVVLGSDAAGQVGLLGWKLLSGPTPRPGDTVRVRLYWQTRERLREDLHSFLHLYSPSLKHSWAVSQNHYPGGIGSIHWIPGKYYIDDFELILPGDVPPVRYWLVAGMVTSEGARLAVPGRQDDVLQLEALTVSPPRVGMFQRTRPVTAAEADAADGLHLQGYDLIPAPAGPVLRLFWETTGDVEGDWTTYVHMLDANGRLAAQFDGPPLAGLLATSAWRKEALYIDRRQLLLPEGLEPGEYLLRVGLYNTESQDRLLFVAHAGDKGHFDEGQLLIPFSFNMAASGPDLRPATLVDRGSR